METVAQKTKRIIADTLGIDRNTLLYDSNLAQDYGIDSLDMIELVTMLEKEFNMTIPDERIARMRTVGDFIEFFEKTKVFPLNKLANGMYGPFYTAPSMGKGLSL